MRGRPGCARSKEPVGLGVSQEGQGPIAGNAQAEVIVFPAE